MRRNSLWRATALASAFVAAACGAQNSESDADAAANADRSDTSTVDAIPPDGGLAPADAGDAGGAESPCAAGRVVEFTTVAARQSDGALAADIRPGPSDGLTASCGGAGALDLVVHFAAPESGLWSFTLARDPAAASSAVISLRTTCGDAATERACQSAASGRAVVSAALGAGEGLFILVDGLAPNVGFRLVASRAAAAACDAPNAEACPAGTACVDRDGDDVHTCMTATAPLIDRAEAFWNPSTGGFGLHVVGSDAETDARSLRVALTDASGEVRDRTLQPGLGETAQVTLDQQNETFTFDVSMAVEPGFVPVRAAVRAIDDADLESELVGIGNFGAPVVAQPGEPCDTFQAQQACALGGACTDGVCVAPPTCANGMMPIDLSAQGGDGHWLYAGNTFGHADGTRGACGGEQASEDVLVFQAPADGTYKFQLRGLGPAFVLYTRDTCDANGVERYCACAQCADAVETLAAGERVYLYVDGARVGDAGAYELTVDTLPPPTIEAASAFLAADGSVVGLEATVSSDAGPVVSRIEYQILDPAGVVVFPPEGDFVAKDAIPTRDGVDVGLWTYLSPFPVGHIVRMDAIDPAGVRSARLDVPIVDTPVVGEGATCDVYAVFSVCDDGLYCTSAPLFVGDPVCAPATPPSLTTAVVTIAAGATARVLVEGDDATEDVLGFGLDLLDADGAVVSSALVDAQDGEVNYTVFERLDLPRPGHFTGQRDFVQGGLNSFDLGTAVSAQVWAIDRSGLTSPPLAVPVTPPPTILRGAACGPLDLDGVCAAGDICDFDYNTGRGACIESIPPTVQAASVHRLADGSAVGVVATVLAPTGTIDGFGLRLLDGQHRIVSQVTGERWDPDFVELYAGWGAIDALADGTYSLRRVLPSSWALNPGDAATLAQATSAELRVFMTTGLAGAWFPVPLTEVPALDADARCHPDGALGLCPAEQICPRNAVDPYLALCQTATPPEVATAEIHFNAAGDALGVRLTGTDAGDDLLGFIVSFQDAAGASLEGPRADVSWDPSQAAFIYTPLIVPGADHTFLATYLFPIGDVPPGLAGAAATARIVLVDAVGAQGAAVDVPLGPAPELAEGDVCEVNGVFGVCGGGTLCLPVDGVTDTCAVLARACPDAWHSIDLSAAVVGPGHWHFAGNNLGGPDIGGGSCGGSGATAVFSFTAPAAGLYTFITQTEAGSSVDTVLYARVNCAAPPGVGELACNDDNLLGRDVMSRIALQLDAGQTIYPIVDNYGGGIGGPFELDVVSN